MMRRAWIHILTAVLLIAFAGNATAGAQGRMSDRDVERLMQNLKEDAQPFRESFANALKKSTIRKTSQEKDDRALTETFAKQASRALESFQHNRKAESEVAALVSTAGQIDPLVYSLKLNRKTTSQWEKLRTELHQVAQAFGVRAPYFEDQPSGGIANAGGPHGYDGGTCLASVGAKRSKQLVDECLQVSPATHPPCNAQNACSLIVGEIKRGCAMIGQGAPAFCALHR